MILFMKTCLLLFAIVINGFSMSIQGQDHLFHIKMENETVRNILKAIENKTTYRFFFSDDFTDIGKRMTVDVETDDVSELLTKILDKSTITFKILDNNMVVITPIKLNQRQGIPVSGIVADEKDDPLPGVNVILKGTTTGTVTDSDGRFSLAVPDKNAMLVFSFIGYHSQEITVGEQTSIHLTMKEANAEIGEVVVVGYGVQKKESLTSAITSVNTDLLESRSINRTATGLQGIAPGVNIRQTTGRPGYSATTFDIRGAAYGTFSDNSALVIIDGVVDNIDNVNVEDIEKISILKDAAAAAIYGARATGGVVLITTKKGAKGKPVINYSYVAGLQTLPFGKYKFLNTAEWMRANNEASRLDGMPDIYTAEQIAKYENSTDPNYPVESQWTDWIDKRAWQQTHNLSIKGGNDVLSVYASGNYVDQGGFIDNDDYKKLNFLVNVDYTPFKKFTIGASVGYYREFVTRPVVGEVFALVRNSLLNPPTDPFYLPNGDYNNSTTLGANPKYTNSEGGNRQYQFDNLRMSMTAKYQILDGWFVRYTTAAKLNYYYNNNFYKKVPFKNNDGVIYGYNRAEVAVTESWDRITYLNNLVMSDYTKTLGNHSFYLMGGFQAESNLAENISASASKFPNNEIRRIAGSSGSGIDKSGNSSASQWSIASVIGKLSYSYHNRYYLDASFRYDGSSRFSPRERWGLFPSVGVSWRISEESFMENIDLISSLKLRASWGQLGNQGNELYPYTTLISMGNYAFGNGVVTTANVGSPVNYELSWERKTSKNIGLDFGFLNNRLTGSFDYFYDTTNGILGRPSVPTTYGGDAPYQNTYKIDNRGYEIEVTWNDRIGDFRYHVGFNFSDFRDKIVSLGGMGTTDPEFGSGLVQKGANTFNAEGKPRNSLYLYRTNGLFVDQEELNNHAFISSLTLPGDIVFVDTDNNDKITPDDKVPDKRTTTAHYFFGINLGAEYKGLDLSVILNGVGQRWAYRNGGGHYLSGVRASLALLEDNYNNRWTEQNPNKWADQTRLTQNNWIANEYSTISTGPCEYHLRNYGYLRLKNIQLGYTLPRLFTQKVSISKLRLYVSAENLLTYAPGYKEPIDPESRETYSEDGSVFFGPPQVVNFGVSVTF